MHTALLTCLLCLSAAASSHFDESSEEHKSGYGYTDRAADFGHENEWIDEAHKHSADLHLSQGSGHHSSKEKLTDAGAEKHSDEAVNRGKDSKQSKYGFFDYHFVEPQYRLEKFYTNEERSRKFDEGEHNHAAAKHRDIKDHAKQTNQRQHQAENAHSTGDKLDRSKSGQHGHKDTFDEHYNQLDKSAHAFDSHSGPFRDGQYIPLFAPY